MRPLLETPPAVLHLRAVKFLEEVLSARAISPETPTELGRVCSSARFMATPRTELLEIGASGCWVLQKDSLRFLKNSLTSAHLIEQFKKPDQLLMAPHIPPFAPPKLGQLVVYPEPTHIIASYIDVIGSRTSVASNAREEQEQRREACSRAQKRGKYDQRPYFIYTERLHLAERPERKLQQLFPSASSPISGMERTIIVLTQPT